jgi:ribosome biogenesis GTPase
MTALQSGLVFKSTGSWYTVQMADQRFLACRVRGKLKIAGLKTTNPVAVGDKVLVKEDLQHKGTGVITEVLPRENVVMRKSVHKTEHSHLIGANIDQALLMVTIKHPRTSLGFIDRFLVSTDAYRIPTALIINKIDLYTSKDEDKLLELQEIYEPLNIRCFPVSVKQETGLEEIDQLLADKITLLAGHSGTGKSTLLNHLHPEIKQAVSEVSTFANKGVHTTTFAEMFNLPSSGKIIDTPGIKELGLIDIGDHELSDYFPEMRALLGACKFHNCSHTHEPKCAVRQALDEGTIAVQRYMSYLSMLENVDSRR